MADWDECPIHLNGPATISQLQTGDAWLDCFSQQLLREVSGVRTMDNSQWAPLAGAILPIVAGGGWLGADWSYWSRGPFILMDQPQFVKQDCSSQWIPNHQILVQNQSMSMIGTVGSFLRSLFLLLPKVLLLLLKRVWQHYPFKGNYHFH